VEKESIEETEHVAKRDRMRGECKSDHAKKENVK